MHSCLLLLIWTFQHHNTQPVLIFSRVRITHLERLEEGTWFHTFDKFKCDFRMALLNCKLLLCILCEMKKTATFSLKWNRIWTDSTWVTYDIIIKKHAFYLIKFKYILTNFQQFKYLLKSKSSGLSQMCFKVPFEK